MEAIPWCHGYPASYIVLSALRRPLAGEGPAWRILLIALLISTFVLPYMLSAWWKFIPSCVLIIVLMRALAPGHYRRFLGIGISWRHLLLSGGLLVTVHLLASLIIPQVAKVQQVTYSSECYTLFWGVGLLFQALNEEMVYRALLLGAMQRWWHRAGVVSVLAAAMFSGTHYVFFIAGDGVALSLPTMVTLFAFGLAANVLFLHFGHVGFAYALHAGWNTVRFAANYMPATRSVPLKEAETFNLIEGSGLVLMFVITALVISVVCIRGDQHRKASR